jgi:hypothetical protein
MINKFIEEKTENKSKFCLSVHPVENRYMTLFRIHGK